MTDVETIVEDLKRTQWEMADEIERLRAENQGLREKYEVDRIKEVNKEAYHQAKSRAQFMCLDTSTWKDPE